MLGRGFDSRQVHHFFSEDSLKFRKYRMTLKVEITCPEDPKDPKKTITPDQITAALLPKKGYGGYAVCGPRTDQLTADMKILEAEFTPVGCEHCGRPYAERPS